MFRKSPKRLAILQTILPTLALVLMAPGLKAGEPEITSLVLEGDIVAGVGTVNFISNMAINNAGSWLVEVDTDGGTDEDAALLSNGTLVLRESDPLPTGAELGGFDSITLNNAGQSGFNFFLDATAGNNDDSSVNAYLDTSAVPLVSTVLVLQEGEDTPGLPAGTPLIGIFDVKINNNAELLVTISVDDPTIPSTVDRVMSIWTTDPAIGGVSTDEVVAKEGDILTGQVAGLTDFGTAPHESAFNDSSNIFFAADIPTGDSLYFYDGAFTLVAQEGSASPVASRNWQSLTTASLDLNNNNETVFRGSLDGDTASNSILVKNGAKLIQEGDTLPAIGGVFAFTSFGTGPLHIDDAGNVLWFGDWNDPDDTVDTGLFLNDQLLIQEGVTSVPGLGTIDSLRGVEDGYHMSNDGRFIIFEAVLDDGTDGAFLIELGSPIFADGFESGDTTSWSSTTGG